jgi:hypothetical protein
MLLVVLAAAVLSFALGSAAAHPVDATLEAASVIRGRIVDQNGGGPTGAQGRPVQIAGRLVTQNGRPLRSATVIMSPQREGGIPARTVSAAQIEPDGHFSFRGVLPGHYVIRARGETEGKGPSLFAAFRVAVQERDVGGLELMLTPGATIEGQVECRARDGAIPPRLSTLHVRASNADGPTFGDTTSGAVREDGSFRLAGVMPGTHVLMIDGLPFPWRISEAHLRGRDIVERAFDIEGDVEFRNVRVVLTDTAAGVTGAVAAPAGVAPEALLVVAFPADALRRRVPLRFVRVGRVERDGTYRVIDLAAGEYLVAAVTGIIEADVVAGEALDRLAASATAVRLAPGEVRRVEIGVVAWGHEKIP